MTSDRSRFARLSADAMLHVGPMGGSVARRNSREVYFISRAAAEGLVSCDGMQPLDSILRQIQAAHAEASLDLLQSASELACLIARGLICLEDHPSLSPPRFTGDFDTFYPTNLQVELTTGCNLSCFYCYRNAGPTEPEGRLPTSRLLRILDDLAATGLQSVELSGGEPLFHEDFADILDFCGRKFRIIGLLTNGTMIGDRIAAILHTYRDKVVASVSLDSHIAETHDRRRGRQGAFERSVRGVQRLVQAGVLTRVSMSVDEDNWQDVEDTLLLAKSLGAMTFAYSPILPFGRGKQKFRFWEQKAREVVEFEKSLQQRYRGFLDLMTESAVGRLDEPGGCGAGWRVYAMDPHGFIRPCVTFDEGSAIFGNLVRQTPNEVFSSARARAYAEVIPPTIESCGECRWALFCRRCLYRGLVASEWVEHCQWLNAPATHQWRDLSHAPH